MKIWIESSWFGLLFLLFSSSSVVMGHYHIHDDIFSTNIDPRTAAAAEGVAGKDFNLTNLQAFTGALGGIVAPPITNSGQASRPYEVNGSTFPDFPTAFSRSCDNQHNECASAANAAGNNKQGGSTSSLTVGGCDTQSSQCKDAGTSATLTNFQVLRSESAEGFVFCDS